MAAYAYDSSRDDVIAQGVTVAGVDVGGMHVDAGAPDDRPRAARAARAADLGRARRPALQPLRAGRRRARRRGRHGRRGARQEPRAATSSAAWRATSPAARRTPRSRRGSPTTSRPIDALVKRVSNRLNRAARDAEVDFPSLAKVKERKGVAGQGGRAAPAAGPGADRARRRSAASRRPCGSRARRSPRRSWRTSTRCSWSRTATTSSCASTSSSSWSRSTRSPSGRSASTPRPGSTTSRTRRSNPTWTRPEQRLGRRPGRQRRPGGAGQPAQGALARDLRRRRHPRHRRDLLARHAASHGCIRDGDPGRDRALRPGSGRRADLHRVGVRRRSRGSAPLPSRAPPGGLRPVCRMQSVPMKTPRSRLRRTAYHIVEASSGPWIRCQGAAGCSSSSTSPASAS